MAEITYFESAGEHNTRQTLEIALSRYQRGDIDAIVIASSYGSSAALADGIFAESGAKLLVVGEVLDGRQSPAEDVVAKLAAKGHRVIWGVTLGAMTAFSRDQSALLVADAYRRVSEGFKVVCEIVMIATSAGYVYPGQKVLAIAGTHRGSDTAVVATAAPFNAFKQFEVNEILCKPIRRAND
jgi:hypothetical protein